MRQPSREAASDYGCCDLVILGYLVVESSYQAMRPICVLLWKHAMVRKRRWMYSVLEFSFSILLILLAKTSRGTDAGWRVERFSSTRAHAPRRILYSPETDLTNSIMDDVGAQLEIPRLDHLPDKLESGMIPVSNDRIQNFLTDMKNIDAIVIFQNTDDLWPERLNYSIRMGQEFNLSSLPTPLVPRYPAANYSFRHLKQDSLGEADAIEEPHNAFDPHLLRLQWAIDIAYQRLRTSFALGQTENPDVFPLADSVNTEKILLAYEVDFCCRFGLLIIFMFLMTNLTNDKNSGIQELMKMEGVSIHTIFLAHFLNVLPGGLVYACGYPIVLKMGDQPMFPHTNSFLIFLALILHFMSIMPWAFIGAYLIDTRTLISVISFFFYYASMLMFDVANEQITKRLDRALTILATSLFPHYPLKWIITEIGQHEAIGRGATFGNMGTAVAEKNGSVLEGLLILIAQIVLFTLLAWYMAQVRPGKYGQAMPCYFLCQWSFWKKKPKVETVTVDEEIYEPNRKFFEEPPQGMTAGIQIINVTKIFPSNVAVSNLSLNVYKGEITVLLGHNGAGKTTLMNIITGLMSASSGKVLVNGMDTSLWRKEVRSQLGLCPQHNLFFADLSVMEHAIFFGLLKDGAYAQVKEDSKHLLQMLNVLDKAHSMASQLSGGMKRRLQLACALAGGADVLILDEPTSGLDVETRRELWDLLLKLRGSRTVLLTTHFMEEADALADRIAAMHAGTLRCHATPMFLKRAVGSGYRLTFSTVGAPNEAALTATIRAAVPDATVRDRALKAISYNLPATDSAKFPTLFGNLEARRTELGIYTIGVGKSTLEEVFMKLCSDVTTTFATDQTQVAFVPVPSLPKVSGPLLCLCQFAYLLRRQFKYTTSKIKTFLFFQAFMPILVIALLADLCNNKLISEWVTWEDAEKGHRNRSDHALDMLRSGAEYVQPDSHAVQRLEISTSPYPGRDIMRTKTNETNEQVNLLGHWTALHAAPRVLVNARRANDTPIQLLDLPKLIYPKMPLFVGMWYILYSMVFTNVLSGFAQLPCSERTTGTRHIHLMCGCPLAVYWAATLTAHVLFGTIFLILPNVVALLALDTDSTTNQPDFLVSCSVILLLALLAICSQMYLVSVLFAAGVTQCLLIILNMIFGLVTPIAHLVYQLLHHRGIGIIGIWYQITIFFSYVMPHHTMVMAISDSGLLARLNAMCELNRHKCPLSAFRLSQMPQFDAVECCASAPGNYKSYWEFGNETPGQGLIIMACQFATYSVLLMLADHGLFKMLRDRCWNSRLVPPPPRFEDPAITAEKAYVEETVTKPESQISDTILCYGIHKKFNSCCGKSHHAVKGINFSVKKGECFGLLGVNGAGKSTTFKMLNAEMFPTRGSVFSNGHFNDLLHKTKYMRTLSYCPQFFGLDDFLTGRQNLELVLTLRGLSRRDVKSEAASWIEEVGLTQHANKRVSTYSGGCARRLAAAAALCQQAGAALLDEPTAGVDAAARRRLHAAILRAKHSKAVIVASHSMDEIEALCDRMVIMSGGEICALGSAAELRARHGAGHAVTFKLFPEFSRYATMEKLEENAEENQGAKKGPKKARKRKKEVAEAAEVPTTSKDPAKAAIKHQFMEEMSRRFSQSELKDDHGTMMHYHIKNAMPYSELFALIEGLKEQFPQLIEDYTLTETTLEEVFLFFAKEALAHKNA